MNVSVIIATRNRRALLAKTLEALGRQSYPHERLEIVVADNGSSDDTRAAVLAAAAANPGLTIRYLFVETPGKSYAVNAALEIALGDIFALTDDDVLPDPDWIRAVVSAIEQNGVDFVAGRILPMWESSPPRWMSPALYGVLAVPDNGSERARLSRVGESSIVPIGANMAVTRQAVRRIGGLRLDLGKLAGSLRTGEDHEFFLRLLNTGFDGVYEPAALVHHWVPAERLDPAYFRRWLYQNGRDVQRVETMYPEPVKRLLGIPRYLWRKGAVDIARVVATTLTNDPSGRFAATTRLGWLAGYVREAWFGERSSSVNPLLEANP